jgi:molecular chaperone HscB
MTAGDHFATFGLPPSFAIDTAALEATYLELQRTHHPDHAAAGTEAERRGASLRSAAINEAYRVLRDPVRRAELLCRMGGIDLDVNDAERGAPTMPQSFLIDMIERREALAESKGRGFAALDALREEVVRELDGALQRAGEALAARDIRTAAIALVERRYFQRLVDEIDAALEAG